MIRKKSVGAVLQQYQVQPADPEVVRRAIDIGQRALSKNGVLRPSLWNCLWGQCQNISPRWWGGQALLLLLCLYLLAKPQKEAILPLLSLCGATLGIWGFPELCRAYSHQMWELEQSCPYNLRQILSLKLLLMGGLDFLLFAAISAPANLRSGISLWEMVRYFLFPFSMICIISFFGVEFLRGKKLRTLLLAAGSSMLLLLFLMAAMTDRLPQTALLWVAALLTASIVLCHQVTHFLANMDREGFVSWNLR